MVEINSLWVGEPLSTMERLCIESHLQNGHEYHLWTYGPLEAPDGVIIEDGNDILPESEIFSYSGPKSEGGGSVSAFSNLFRYRLLKERGGWWCDTDVVALKPFEFDDPYIFASEISKTGSSTPTTCVIKVPQHSDIMNMCYEKSLSVDRGTVGWGTIGPKLLSESVFKCELEEYIVAYNVFCPVNWFNARKEPPIYNWKFFESTCAVHMWQEMWRRKGLNKDDQYPGSLYEELKNCYFIRQKTS